jgi:hypothetical protein
MLGAVLLAVQLAVPPQAGTAACPALEILPGGPVAESRFFAAPVKRIREVVSDAMQAAGVLILEERDSLLRGDRARNRVVDMRLASGDEGIHARILPSVHDGAQGATVTIETVRSGSKQGEPRNNWSAAVLNEAGCLLQLLSVEEPTALSPKEDAAPGIGQEVVLPSGTPVSLYMRRFLFSTDMRVNLRVVLEVASDVTVGKQMVIRRGSLALGRITALKDRSEWELGSIESRAKLAVEYVGAVGGERLAVSYSKPLGGRKRFLWRNPWDSRGNFALRAGTLIETVTAREEKVLVPDKPTP